MPAMMPKLTVAALVVTASAWAAFAGVRAMTSSPAPSIHVRWAAHVSDADRQGLEEQFQLVNAHALGDRSWSYDLLDSRAAVIRRIVEHPAVDDTHHLDRVRFTLAVNTEPGTARRWAWHWWATGRDERRAERVLQTSTAVTALLALGSIRRARHARTSVTPRPAAQE
jgi:hypothetical protein